MKKPDTFSFYQFFRVPCKEKGKVFIGLFLSLFAGMEETEDAQQACENASSDPDRLPIGFHF